MKKSQDRLGVGTGERANQSDREDVAREAGGGGARERDVMGSLEHAS